MSTEKDFQSEQEGMIFQSIVEGLLPKIEKYIDPTIAKFNDFLVKGNIILVKPIDGKAYFFQIAAEDVESIKLKDGKEPKRFYEAKEFIQKIISGEIADEIE